MKHHRSTDEGRLHTFVMDSLFPSQGSQPSQAMVNRQTVGLQEAIKNPRHSETLLENSPKGDSQSNGAAEEVEGMRCLSIQILLSSLTSLISTKSLMKYHTPTPTLKI